MHWSATPQSLERVTQEIRVGHEMFPWLMVLILILVTAENLLANRFHRETPKPAVSVPRGGLNHRPEPAGRCENVVSSAGPKKQRFSAMTISLDRSVTGRDRRGGPGP